MPRLLRSLQYDIKFSFSQVSLTLAKNVVGKMISLLLNILTSFYRRNFSCLKFGWNWIYFKEIKTGEFFWDVINRKKSKFWGATAPNLLKHIAIKVVPKRFELTDLKLWEIIISDDCQTFTDRSACHFLILTGISKNILWPIIYKKKNRRSRWGRNIYLLTRGIFSVKYHIHTLSGNYDSW